VEAEGLQGPTDAGGQLRHGGGRGPLLCQIRPGHGLPQAQQHAVAEAGAVAVDQARGHEGHRHRAGEGHAGGAGLEGSQVRAGVAHPLGKEGHGAALAQHLVDLAEALQDGLPGGAAILGPREGDGPEGRQEGPQGEDLPERGLGHPACPAIQQSRGGQGIQQAVGMVQQEEAGPRRWYGPLPLKSPEPEPSQESRDSAAAHLRPAAAEAGGEPTRGPGR